MLQLQDVTFRYQKEENIPPVIDHLNLDIQDGTFVSVLGSSGSGKSTMLRIIAGLEKPDEGKIRWQESRKQPNVSVVFQDYSLFPWMTAEKNIAFGIRQYRKVTKKEAIEEADCYLKKVGMGEERHKYPCQLSGGMRQRVAIARAFAMDAQMLLMDEPFGALDMKTRYQMQELLLQVWDSAKEKKTILFITHDVEEALLVSERILFLKDGKIGGDYAPKKGSHLKRTELLDTDEYFKLRCEIEKKF